jgi:hydrogenase-4 membrane subunit HyfE
VILSALYMLGEAYIDPTIRAIAIQSFLISALLVILFLHTEDVNLLHLALITAVMRGVVFPRIMLYQVRRFKHKLRETGVGKKTPVLVITGIMIAIIGYALFRSVVFPFLTNTQLSVPFILLLLGFFLIITRRNTLGLVWLCTGGKRNPLHRCPHRTGDSIFDRICSCTRYPGNSTPSCHPFSATGYTSNIGTC